MKQLKQFLNEGNIERELSDKFINTKLFKEHIIAIEYNKDGRVWIALETSKGYSTNGWRSDSYIKNGNVYKTTGPLTSDKIKELQNFIKTNIISKYPEVDHVVVTQELD